MSVPCAGPGLRLTVVIPVKDDARALGRCLEAISRQTHLPDEVVVVDNASADDSAEVARRAGARVVHEPLLGIPAAASAGYDAARPGVIVRCDADTVPPSDWLLRIHVAFVRDPDLVALTGPGRFYDLTGVRARLAQAFYMRGYFWGMHAATANVPLWGSNMAFRTRAWSAVRSRVHRDDPCVHDDVDLSFQLGSAARVRYDRRLVVGVSGRTFDSVGSLGRRFRWAWHTLAVNWSVSPPWDRWAERLSSRSSSRRRRML